MIDVRELIGPLVSVHILLLFFSDDPPVHFISFSVDHLSLIPSMTWLRVTPGRFYGGLLVITRTSTDYKTPVNVSTKYHTGTATYIGETGKSFGVKLQEQRQEVSQRDVWTYTRSISKSVATEQNKLAVTDHAITPGAVLAVALTRWGQ